MHTGMSSLGTNVINTMLNTYVKNKSIVTDKRAMEARLKKLNIDKY